MEMEMARMTNVWLRAGLAIGLMMTLGLVSSSGQDKKAAPKPAPKPVQPPPVVKVGVFDPQRGLVNDAQLQAWEQAYGPQFRQMLRTELHFVRLVAEPTKQQYEKIAADCEPAIKD